MQYKQLAQLLDCVDGEVSVRVEGDYCVFYANGGKEVARIEATTESGPILSCGNLVLHVEEWRAYVKGKQMELTNVEFLTLRALVRNAETTLTRTKLLDYSERDLETTELAINMTICRLRKKLRALDCTHKIVTVREVGYRISKRSDG